MVALVWAVLGCSANQDTVAEATTTTSSAGTSADVGAVADPSPPDSEDQDLSSFEVVCAATHSVGEDGGTSLSAAFEGPAHDALHELAARTEEVDRVASAELLRAKQKVEANPGEPDALIEVAPALRSAIAGALTAVGDTPPPSCTKGSP